MKLDTDALKREMGRHFYTAASLADEVGVSTQSIRMYVWGRTTPKVDTLRRICEVLEVSPDDLVLEW